MDSFTAQFIMWCIYFLCIIWIWRAITEGVDGCLHWLLIVLAVLYVIPVTILLIDAICYWLTPLFETVITALDSAESFQQHK